MTQTSNRSSEHKKAIILAKIRQDYRCEICPSDLEIHGHHIIDHSFGGEPTPENILVVCKVCHDAIHAGKIQISTFDYRKK
jgi:5-methylcytosine-specific restriction endonuclease McrA